jgi:hypothetical protein
MDGDVACKHCNLLGVVARLRGKIQKGRIAGTLRSSFTSWAAHVKEFFGWTPVFGKRRMKFVREQFYLAARVQNLKHQVTSEWLLPARAMQNQPSPKSCTPKADEVTRSCDVLRRHLSKLSKLYREVQPFGVQVCIRNQDLLSSPQALALEHCEGIALNE